MALGNVLIRQSYSAVMPLSLRTDIGYQLLGALCSVPMLTWGSGDLPLKYMWLLNRNRSSGLSSAPHHPGVSVPVLQLEDLGAFALLRKINLLLRWGEEGLG